MYSIILSVFALSNLDNISGRIYDKSILYDVIQLSGGGQRQTWVIQIRRGLCRRISSIIFGSWTVMGVALVLMTYINVGILTCIK